MNENVEILEYIYQNSKMGEVNLVNLSKKLSNKDNKIISLVNDELKEYQSFVKESEKLLKKEHTVPKEKGIIANTMANIEMDVKLLKDNTDASVADILIKGFNMGLIDITKKINSYKNDVDDNILKLAKKLQKFSEENIELLKKYL